MGVDARSPARSLAASPTRQGFFAALAIHQPTGIKQQVTRECEAWLPPQNLSDSRKKRGEGSLWQRRFWEHLIRDETDLSRHVDYIHFNPVKHGYAVNVADWPYSTFHRYVKEGIYPEDWGGVVDGDEEFGE